MLLEILESREASSAFCPLLSDAAKYMTATGITLKSLYPKLFHVTCVAHLFHNCAKKIKSHFEDVDQQIEKVKVVTIKNITKQAKFFAIGYPPQPVLTRWGSWLNAALYYAKNLHEVKTIVESFVGSGILVTRANVSLQSGLAGQLLKIKDQYECLVKLIEKMETAKYTIEVTALRAIQELDFGEDTCSINQYIKKRIQNNNISEKINMEWQDISPAVYHVFQNSQPISASVEKSFSMLKKLLAKDRNFKVENVCIVFVFIFLRQSVKEDAKNTRSVITCNVKNTYIITSIINHRHDHKYAPPYSKKNM